MLNYCFCHSLTFQKEFLGNLFLGVDIFRVKVSESLRLSFQSRYFFFFYILLVSDPVTNASNFLNRGLHILTRSFYVITDRRKKSF